MFGKPFCFSLQKRQRFFNIYHYRHFTIKRLTLWRCMAITILSISRKQYPCWMWMCVSNFCLIVLTFYYSMKFLLNRCTPFSMLYLGKVLQVTKFHCLQALIYAFRTIFHTSRLFDVVFVNSPISLTNAVSFIWMLNLIGDLTHWLGETPSILTHYILS